MKLKHDKGGKAAISKASPQVPLGGILTEGPYEIDGRMTGECRRFG